MVARFGFLKSSVKIAVAGGRIQRALLLEFGKPPRPELDTVLIMIVCDGEGL
jgi:hypothetical protein